VSDDIQAHYSGMEPVDVGDLSSVREERSVIPATKGVKVKIATAENQINPANTYRQFSLRLNLVDGIGEEGKWKGKPLFTHVCYYADPTIYCSIEKTKERHPNWEDSRVEKSVTFFNKRGHLLQLKYLLKAIGAESSTVDGHTLDAILAASFVTVDITVRPRTITPTDGSESYVVQENEARNYKAVPVEDQV